MLPYGTAVVQGASRGLGLQFCRSLLGGGVHQVLATCRQPNQSTGLMELQRQYPGKLRVIPLDCVSESSVAAAADLAKAELSHVDLLVNCAALLHPTGRGETSLRDVNLQNTVTTLTVNSVGPLLTAKYFAPLLMKGQVQGRDFVSALVNISARVGSIAENGLGGWYAYRMSKCALNMATRNLAIELGRGKKKVLCVSLHPGTVDTDLSRPYHKSVPQGKLFSPEYSVQRLLEVVNGRAIDDSGKFFAFDGTEIPT